MGFRTEASYAIRVSGGWATVEADWARFVDVWLVAHAPRAPRAAG